MNHASLLQPHLIQTSRDNSVLRMSQYKLQFTHLIQVNNTMKQSVLRYFQVEREPLPIMEPKGSKHLGTSSSHKPLQASH